MRVRVCRRAGQVADKDKKDNSFFTSHRFEFSFPSFMFNLIKMKSEWKEKWVKRKRMAHFRERVYESDLLTLKKEKERERGKVCVCVCVCVCCQSGNNSRANFRNSVRTAPIGDKWKKRKRVEKIGWHSNQGVFAYKKRLISIIDANDENISLAMVQLNILS